MNEEQMKEYVMNGGKIFTVFHIDTIRDGGTKIIKSTKGDFYINKDDKNFHSDYIPNNENLITDRLLIEYLIDRIEIYNKECENEVKRNNHLLVELKKKHMHVEN